MFIVFDDIAAPGLGSVSDGQRIYGKSIGIVHGADIDPVGDERTRQSRLSENVGEVVEGLASCGNNGPLDREWCPKQSVDGESSEPGIPEIIDLVLSEVA